MKQLLLFKRSLSLGFISIAFVLCSVPVHAQVNKGMPDIKDVILTFFSKYDQTAIQEDGYLKFEKRESGWCITKMKYEDNMPAFKSILFWDKAKQKYESLPFKRCVNPGVAASEDKLEEYNSSLFLDEIEYYNYRTNLYYGYLGWDWDVIQYASTKPAVTDSLLEAFGKAYTTYAITYFYNQFGESIVNDDPERIKLNDNEPIPGSRVPRFLQYERKAIDALTQLSKLNGSYQTKIGNIQWRVADEKFFAYITLRFIGYEKEAQQFLDGLEFPDSLTSRAKQILDETAPNSILFTEKDNVTYPVWYLQAKGYRTDVIAVDENMLVLRRMVAWLDKKYNDSLFSTDSSVYMNPQFDFALFNHDYATGDTMRLDSFLERLYNSPYLTQISNGNKTTYFTDDKTFKFFTKNIYIDVDTLKAAQFFGSNHFEPKIYPCINKDVLYSFDMLVLDIIKQQFLKKHIYFSYIPAYPCGKKYLLHRNYTWELMPVQE